MGPYYSEGPYMGRVVFQELGASKNKGTPQFLLRVQIMASLDAKGEPTALPGPAQERSVYIYLTEASMEMALKALKVLGYRKTSVKFLDPNVAGCVDFTGTEVPLYCKHESYENETREKWSISTRLAASAGPVDIRKLDRLFGPGLKEIASGAEPSNPNNILAEAAALAENNEDVPF